MKNIHRSLSFSVRHIFDSFRKSKISWGNSIGICSADFSSCSLKIPIAYLSYSRASSRVSFLAKTVFSMIHVLELNMMSSYYLVEFNFTIHIIFIRRIFVIGGRKRNKLLNRARNPVERKKSRTCWSETWPWILWEQSPWMDLWSLWKKTSRILMIRPDDKTIVFCRSLQILT